MKNRLNIYFAPDLLDRLAALAAQRGVTKSSVVEAALASFLSPDAADRREAVFVRRLDRVSRQLERLERDLTIGIETLALFVRFWLSVTPPLPESAQATAKAKGSERYEGFIETLGRRLQQGRSLIREVSEEIYPEARASAQAADDQAPAEEEEGTDATS